MSEPILISLAPGVLALPELLRAAIDAEKVGAARIHLAPQPDLGSVIAALREHTHLLVTAEQQHADADAVSTETKPVNSGDVNFAAQTFGTPTGAGWFELIFEASMTDKQVVLQTGVLATRFEVPVTVAGNGTAAIATQLSAVAAGFHLRVGSSHTPLIAGATPRDDAGLVARASGLARLTGRPPMTPAQAREFLGLT